MNKLDPLPIAATFSKDPKFWGKDFEPAEVGEGDGATIYGRDGVRYLDMVSGLGAVLLGYPTRQPDSNAPADLWARRIAHEVQYGAGFSLPHQLERQVAEKLVTLLGAHVPGWIPQGLGVRFGLSGSDACTMAIRLARAVKSSGNSVHDPRQKIISIGYHGWGSDFVTLTPPAWGIPTVSTRKAQAVSFGDLDFLAQLLENGNVAAVIIEQPAQDPPDGYWQEVRRLCTQHGALLILDEVVTWPRFAMGGAAELYGIEPDLMCLGKGLGNGIPISCIVGRREYFDWFARNDPVFVSSTHFGNTVSLAACDSVLDVWSEAGVKHIWEIGGHLMSGLNDAGYKTVGQPVRFLVQHANISERAYFVRRLCDEGVLGNRPWLANWAHSQADVEKTLLAARAIKQEMRRIDVAEVMKDRLPLTLFEDR